MVCTIALWWDHVTKLLVQYYQDDFEENNTKSTVFLRKKRRQKDTFGKNWMFRWVLETKKTLMWQMVLRKSGLLCCTQRLSRICCRKSSKKQSKTNYINLKPHRTSVWSAKIARKCFSTVFCIRSENTIFHKFFVLNTSYS